MSHARLVFVWSALLALIIGGCESKEAKCNRARIEAHDAWDAVGARMWPLCAIFVEDPAWDREHDQALASFRNFVPTGGMGFAVAYEDYRPRLNAACGAVRTAFQTATGPAVAARDATRAASAGLADVFANHRKFADAMAREAQNESSYRRFAEAAREHSDAMAAFQRAGLVAPAEAKSRASWEVCSEIAP